MHSGFSWDRAGFVKPGSQHLGKLCLSHWFCRFGILSAGVSGISEVPWMEGHLRLHRSQLKSRRRHHTHRRFLQSRGAPFRAFFSSLSALGQLSQRDHDLMQHLHERHQTKAQAKALQVTCVDPLRRSQSSCQAGRAKLRPQVARQGCRCTYYCNPATKVSAQGRPWQLVT